MLYGGYDYQLGKERTVEMRREVEQNRLVASLAKGARVYGEDASHRGMAARSATVVMALFR